MKNQAGHQAKRAEHSRPPSARLSRPGLKRGLVVVGVGVAVVGAVAFLALRSTVPTSSPTRSATSLLVGVPVGNPAPHFQLTDVFGRSVSRSSLVADRPGLLFFTTTYCLPCVEGLKALKQFERELGSDRFRVLIVFVDPRENTTDLRAYQERYGFPQAWYYAPDTDDLLQKYRVRSLDTKFAVDRQGVVRFVDIYPATTETWRTALAAVGITR